MMRTMLVAALTLGLVFALGCDGDGGVNSGVCNEACNRLGTLCGSEGFDSAEVAECKQGCAEDIDEMGPDEVAAALNCLRNAGSCAQAMMCIGEDFEGNGGNGGGNGGDLSICTSVCGALAARCSDSWDAGDTAECMQQCSSEVAGMSAAGIAATMTCVDQSTTCLYTMTCLGIEG